MIILPRQARDKHRENSKKSTVFLQPLPPSPAPAGGGGKGGAGGGERQEEEGMSVPVHRCIGGSSGRHFISGSADCMGRGKLEKTLGYAAVHKSSNTPVRRTLA